MTIITAETLAEMRVARISGETVKSIASRYGVSAKAVYQSFSRNLGATPMPGPANDNHPDRVTRMMPRNGGCSTTSGKVPVTLMRIPTLDKPHVDPSARELAQASMGEAA